MYNYWCCNIIAISECVENCKENLIFIDKELKMGENILLKNLIRYRKKSSPNLCVNSSSSYISPSMLPLSSGDLIEWSLVCHSILSYQKFCD